MLDRNTAELVREDFNKRVICGTWLKVEDVMRMEPVVRGDRNAYDIYAIQFGSSTYMAWLKFDESGVSVKKTSVHCTWYV